MSGKGATSTILLLATLLISSAAHAQLDAREIVDRSVEANKADWKAEPEYDYSVHVHENGHTKTYKMQMIEGSPYEQLIAENGKPLPPRRKAQAERKLQQTITDRRNETPEERKSRIAEWERTRQRNHFLMEQMTQAFDFKLEGTRKMDGHEAYELAATPRSGYQPPDDEAKVLTGMKGKLWIDQASFQWVKVQAEVIHTVSIEGFLARVEPGTKFELQQGPVAPGVWLPTFFSVKSRAKILFFVPHNMGEEDTYFDYHKTPGIQVTPKDSH
jgi:hypothetical protein